MSETSTATADAYKICRKCGAKIFSPASACSACLFETALGPLTDNDVGDKAAAKMAMQFGDYELVEEIGRGGQGVVYRARQKSLNRTVALKIIGLGQWASTPHLKRFRHEAEAAARLEHPRIVPIYEIDERDGSCYFSMKFIEGGQLDSLVRQGSMATREAAELLVKIARTVQFAHEHGILHRDIKPGNILVDKSGEPHLTDFGLARLVEQESTITNSFDVLGTPSYMAPEQAAGHSRELTSAADVYSLGAVFYHMLTAHPPFAGGTTYETIRMVMETEPRHPRLWNPKIDVDLATICLKCLEKDPARRYPTAATLADDVERWLRHEPILARRTGIIRRGAKWVQRNPTPAVLAGSMAVLVAALGLIIWKSDFAHVSAPNGIAVLPFENLSEDKTNTYFVDGIQDEILTRLAKVSALKVISRSSTQQYATMPQNLPQIARQLGVANILEGSVQKVAGQAHINVQLIHAATDEHLWAETYDRNLDDVFNVEGEVAAKVAEALKAKLTGAEERALQQRPTNSAEAYDAYLRGLDYALRPHQAYSDHDILNAAEHFTDAVRKDPNFALAWVWLTRVTSLGYFNLSGKDPAALRETARNAATQVQRLRPGTEEAALAEGYYRYYGEMDYEGATVSFKKAHQLAPQQSDTLGALGLVSRRTSDWAKSLDYFREALETDPRNLSLLSDYADTLCEQRDYPSALQIYDRVLEMSPNNSDALVNKAGIYQSQARLAEAAMSLATLPPDPTAEVWFPTQVSQKIYERRFRDGIVLIEDALAKHGQEMGSFQKISLLADLGNFQRWAGDVADSLQTWTRVKAEIESLPDSRKKGTFVWTFETYLAEAHAELGEKAEAGEILNAIVDRRDNDRLNIARLAGDRARVAMHMGNRDVAIGQLEIAAQNPADPGGVTYGDLKLNPLFDPLRGDMRFEKIVNSLAPTETQLRL